MEETLEQLESRYFMLQMADHWTDSDYKLADELNKKIKMLKENKKDE